MTQAPELVCTLGSPCATEFPPDYNDPQTTWACPGGSRIESVLIGLNDGDDRVGCVSQVRCDNGLTLAGFAGDCSNDRFPTTMSCSGHGGIAGFQVRAGDHYDAIIVECEDGFRPAAPPYGSGGDDRGLRTCPDTHYLSNLKAETSGGDDDLVTSLQMTCSPMSQRCVGDRLNDAECKAYCTSNQGQCDAALRDYCSEAANFDKPVCGCALPRSQYPILSLESAAAVSIPIACDRRCQDPGAIPLAGTGTCNIGTVCVQSDIDITAVQSTVGRGITVSQTCGQEGGQNGAPFFSFSNPTFIIVLIVAVILVIVVIVVIIALVARRRKVPPAPPPSAPRTTPSARSPPQPTTQRQPIRSSRSITA